MVGMLVGEQDPVQVGQAGAQHLVAEVRSAIEQDGVSVVGDDGGRGAQAVVARIGRS